MAKTLQRVLLSLGVVALIVLLAEIALSVAATIPSSTPARVVHVQVGAYPLTVSLYKDPANAGFAMPFAIAPGPGTRGPLTFDVSSLPGKGVDATPVHGSITPDGSVPGGVRGTVEITVQGTWFLRIMVTGPQGQGVASVPITATAPPAMPLWLGWPIGFAPLYGLLILLFVQRGRKRTVGQTAAA